MSLPVALIALMIMMKPEWLSGRRFPPALHLFRYQVAAGEAEKE